MKKGPSHVSFLISRPKAAALASPSSAHLHSAGPGGYPGWERPLSASTEHPRRKWLCSLISNDLLFSCFHKIYDLRGKPSKCFLKDTDPRCKACSHKERSLAGLESKMWSAPPAFVKHQGLEGHLRSSQNSPH